MYYDYFDKHCHNNIENHEWNDYYDDANNYCCDDDSHGSRDIKNNEVLSMEGSLMAWVFLPNSGRKVDFHYLRNQCHHQTNLHVDVDSVFSKIKPCSS